MDYVTKDTALTATADSIREKTGATDPITWLEELGFSEAIAGIESGGGVTYGSITPISIVKEIEHGLGKIPKFFIWYADFINITGQMLSPPNGIMEDEQSFDSLDWNHTIYMQRPVFIMADGKIFSYTLNFNVDWGFFTKGSVEKLDTWSVSCDDIKFTCHHHNSSGNTLIPHSEEGNVIINWFAIGA